MPRAKNIEKARRLRVPRLYKTQFQLRRETLEILGVDEVDVMASVKIEKILKEADVLPKVWQYLEESSLMPARRLLAVRKKLTASQVKSVPFEAFCVAAKVPPGEAFACICEAAFSHGEQAALLKRSVHFGSIVDATIEAAKKPTGRTERNLLFKEQGKIRSVTTLVQPEVVEQPVLLPPIEDLAQTVSDRFNERFPTPKAIPAAALDPIDLDEEEEAEDDEEDEDEE